MRVEHASPWDHLVPNDSDSVCLMVGLVRAGPFFSPFQTKLTVSKEMVAALAASFFASLALFPGRIGPPR